MEAAGIAVKHAAAVADVRQFASVGGLEAVQVVERFRRPGPRQAGQDQHILDEGHAVEHLKVDDQPFRAGEFQCMGLIGGVDEAFTDACEGVAEPGEGVELLLQRPGKLLAGDLPVPLGAFGATLLGLFRAPLFGWRRERLRCLGRVLITGLVPDFLCAPTGSVRFRARGRHDRTENEEWSLESERSKENTTFRKADITV